MAKGQQRSNRENREKKKPKADKNKKKTTAPAFLLHRPAALDNRPTARRERSRHNDAGVAALGLRSIPPLGEPAN